MMFSMGDGVHGFTMDPSIGEFVLTHRNVRTHKHTATTHLTSSLCRSPHLGPSRAFYSDNM